MYIRFNKKDNNKKKFDDKNIKDYIYIFFKAIISKHKKLLFNVFYF